MSDDLLVRRVSVAAASKYLGCPPQTVRRYIRERRLQAIDTAPPDARRARWRIPVHELRRFIAEAQRAAERRLEREDAHKEHTPSQRLPTEPRSGRVQA